MNHEGSLSQTELAVLREHGIVWFADRVIFATRPPMSEDAIAAIAAQCVGALPQDLLDLWRCTAGGKLAYDLSAQMAGNQEALSWCELFYNGSKGYRLHSIPPVTHFWTTSRPASTILDCRAS